MPSDDAVRFAARLPEDYARGSSLIALSAYAGDYCLRPLTAEVDGSRSIRACVLYAQQAGRPRLVEGPAGRLRQTLQTPERTARPSSTGGRPT